MYQIEMEKLEVYSFLIFPFFPAMGSECGGIGHISFLRTL